VPVSVLIVNYRVYDDLDRSLAALESILTDADEVIVVDNESDPARLAPLQANHPRVRTIASPTNLGFAAGINRAAREARHDVLLVLNPDTIPSGALVRTLESWLRDHPDTGVVGPRVFNPDGTVQPSARRFPGLTTAFGGRTSWLTERFPNNWVSRRNLLGLAGNDPIDVDWIAGSCFMTTRTAFDKAGGFDESFFLYWEDADYCRRLKGLGFKVTYVPMVSVQHAGGRSSALVPRLAIRSFHRSAVHLYVKHGGLLTRMAAPLVAAAMRVRMEWRLRRSEQSRH
jgi:N-acetylglucosaminyl-diphospho-decaprenol L-rhamnosyltransferase